MWRTRLFRQVRRETEYVNGGVLSDCQPKRL